LAATNVWLALDAVAVLCSARLPVPGVQFDGDGDGLADVGVGDGDVGGLDVGPPV
jgi:hypothetical protein